ncbi:unnamed protein product [Owenia fusiformis]|uniref:Uncharacterized protein n=1 Tax=Owenia fusiformis TaxID=6347 RepID=A0A8J1UXI6_OWEFU|nr:unnamed protein product [Owenia fusiformis]
MFRSDKHGVRNFAAFLVAIVCLGITVTGSDDFQNQRDKRGFGFNSLEGDSTLKKVGIAKPKPGGGLGGFGFLVFGKPRPTTTEAPKVNNNADEPIIIGEGFTKDEICFNLAIALDISCSVSLDSKGYAKNLIKSILRAFQLNADKGVRINLVTFADEVIQTIHFDPSKTKDELYSIVDELVIVPSVCRTNTWQAIKAVNALFFSDSLNENDVISHGPKILMIIGDGRGSPKSEQGLTESYTKNLRENDVTIIWIETELDSNKRKTRIETEIDLIMAKEAVLHMNKDSDIADKLIHYLESAGQCWIKSARTQPDFSRPD